MNETAEETSPPASSSPRSSPCCSSTQTWPPTCQTPPPPCQMEQDRHHVEMRSSPPFCFYEELFCSSHTSSGALVPLAGALMASSSSPQSDVVKQGYLGKLERNHRRYFVLRAGSHTGPSRLEWYKNQEKFTAVEKSAGKAALFGSSKQGVIYLRCCLGVSRSISSRKGHTVALYAKDQTMVLVVEDQGEQEEWYQAIKRLMEEERKDDEHGEGFDEEDDGYCTLPPAAFFKECTSTTDNGDPSSPVWESFAATLLWKHAASFQVWPITVKSRGLGCTKSMAGESRLCLTATSLVLVRVAACSDLPSVTIPLLSVRRFGHLDGSFFLELGRSAPNGPGEIWMEGRDQGSAAVAQHIHEVVREAVTALRALPDFSRSPTSNNQFQSLLTSKRCRPKYRDRLNVRPLGSRLALPPRSPTKCYLDHDKPESSLSSTSHVSPVRSHQPETGSYMEMKMDQHLAVDKERDCERPGDHCGMEGQESGEEQSRGYMMMSPQVSPSSPVLPQDDYVTMASPHKHNRPASSSLQTSVNSSASDSAAPLHPSHHQSNEPRWLLTSLQADQSQRSISSTEPATPTQTSASWSPVRSDVRSAVMTPFVTSGPGDTGPGQACPISGTGRSSRAGSDPSVRRYRLSLCLPACLQAEDRN